MSYHEHNEAARAAELIEKLRSGATVALVPTRARRWSSAIPDTGGARGDRGAAFRLCPFPGFGLFRGAFAAGLATDSFRFCGFLPPKPRRGAKILESVQETTCTQIFYETPHRMLETLEDITLCWARERWWWPGS